jgi:parvin
LRGSIAGDNMAFITRGFIIGSTERDVFDKLFAEAPEKLEAVKRSLCQFANKVLLELDINVNDIGSQFHNGVNFILMMGLLEGYFIPLHLYHYNPTTVDNKIDNVRLAFKLMSSCGLDQTKVNPQDVVERDLKSILRVLYSIFQKYKSKIQQTPSTAGQGPRPT